MSESPDHGQSVISPKPYAGNAQLIQGDDGRFILADSEEDARAFAEYDGGMGDKLTYAGWVGRVPYPEDYESREEWEASPDFCEEWWEAMQAPVNNKQRAHLRQAWRVER